MKFNSFIKECSEKDVFKRLSIYIVTAWVLIQVLSVIYIPLALPEKSVSILLIILLVVFPFYIYFIWHTQLAPLEYEEEFQGKKGQKKHHKFRNTYFSFMGVISFVCIAFAFYITNNSFIAKKLTLTTFETSNKIGILGFNNNTGKPDLDVIGKMTSDWIIHSITENNQGQVISPEIVNDYLSIIKASNDNPDNAKVLKQYFKPSRVITGSYFLNDSTLLFRASITDGNMDETLVSFKPIKCQVRNPLDCIDDLKEKIVGYLATQKDKEKNLEMFPPKFKAYEYLLDAKENFEKPELHLELLNKAIAEDPLYFEAKVLRVAYYYNTGQYATADSLRKAIRIDSKIDKDKRQRNLLNHYEALMEGNNRKIYETVILEYNYTPEDLQTSSSAMVVGTQFVNRLNDIDSMYRRIDMKNFNLDNCNYCVNRIYMQGMANLGLGKYRQVIKLIKPALRDVDAIFFKKLLVAAYVRSDSPEALKDFLKSQEISTDKGMLYDLYLYTGMQYLLIKNPDKAKTYFSLIIDEKYPEQYIENYIKASMYLGNFDTAKSLVEQELKKQPESMTYLKDWAIITYKLDDNEKSKLAIMELNSLRAEYQFGELDYKLASYYAAIEDKENALRHLLRSIAEGNYYTLSSYNNDPSFVNYLDTPEFKKIMTYWH